MRAQVGATPRRRNLSNRRWAVLGFVWTMVLGSALHFTYAWSQDNRLVGLFSAANESTWEHLKLLVVPATIWAGLRYRWRAREWFEASTSDGVALVVGLLLIGGGFDFYRVFLPDEFALDILLFVGAAACTHFGSALARRHTSDNRAWRGGMALLMAAVFLTFALSTVMPPHLPIFRDPHTGGYGFGAHQSKP